MAKYAKLEDIAELWEVSVRTVENWLKKNDKPIIKSKLPLEMEMPEKINIISEMLGVPEATIKKWVKANKIPNLWWGGISFKVSDIIEWANKKGYNPTLDDNK